MFLKMAGKVFRYLSVSLLILFGLAVVYLVCINLYVRYAPYDLPEPTGKVPNLSEFTADTASPIPVDEQQQIWVAKEYLYDHEGKYQNPQEGRRMLEIIAKSGSDEAAHKAIELYMHEGFACTEDIPFIYQFKNWRLYHLAFITPVSDAELVRLYDYWKRLRTWDERRAQATLKLFSERLCITKNPQYNETFGKHM